MGLTAAKALDALGTFDQALPLYISIPFDSPLPVVYVGAETIAGVDVIVAAEYGPDQEDEPYTNGGFMAALTEVDGDTPVYLRPIKHEPSTPLVYIGLDSINGAQAVRLMHE